MFENVGWGEILVLLVAGLFILGPERLPEAAAWLGRAVRQVKEFAAGARDQLRSELGPQYEQFRQPLEDLRAPLRELRDLDPRRSLGRTLFDDAPLGKPNGWAPHADGSPARVDPPGGSPAAGPPGRARPAAPRPLSPDERPPIDPDAT